MKKDFRKWHSVKELLHKKEKEIYFHEREIWWCSLGVNIGFEEDGKNDQFERPIIILKKFNNYLLWILPLTSKEKFGKYYYKFIYDGKRSMIILSQIRAISNKRLLRKMGMIPKADFKKVRERVRSFL
jgi:mRNA interferase MazF